MGIFNFFRKGRFGNLSSLGLKDKVIIIGISFIDNNNNLIELYQTHGTIIELTMSGILRIKRKDNSVFQIPFDNKSIKKAGNGEYKATSTDQIIKNPDYMMTMEVSVIKNHSIDLIKNYGYRKPE